MSKKKKNFLILLLVIVSLAAVSVAVVVFLLTPFFQPRSDVPFEQDEVEESRMATTDNSNQTSAPTIMPPTIDVLSTTSAFPFVQRWVAQYENQQLASPGNVNVNYLPDSELLVAQEDRSWSRTGLAIVGVPNENSTNTLNIPVSAQAVAIVYNIPSFPDIPSGLRLNSTMVSLILNGSISGWNDEAIKDLNPSLNLPDERIVVVHGDDDNNSSSSSSLILLNQYLGLQSLSWPKNDSITVSGPAELAETVRKTPYSVGYVDFSYAVQTRMTYAAVGDTDGNYIVPSIQTIDQAVDVALQFQESITNRTSLPLLQQSPPTINASRIENGSYPIVGLYYASLLASDDERDDDGQRSVARLDFVEWVISETGGQQTLLEVQYPPIYSSNEELATYATMVMDTMKNNL